MAGVVDGAVVVAEGGALGTTAGVPAAPPSEADGMGEGVGAAGGSAGVAGADFTFPPAAGELWVGVAHVTGGVAADDEGDSPSPSTVVGSATGA